MYNVFNQLCNILKCDVCNAMATDVDGYSIVLSGITVSLFQPKPLLNVK